MNTFVDYLNSTNNAKGNSTGSLAESQVKSPYYEKVKVERNLGKLISSTVRDKNYQTFILTGHAGDGKTSILVQVLRDLSYLPEGEGLKKEGDYPDFYYVKDMSEINEEEQVEILKRALKGPERGQTSLLISNTGPLINTFMRLIEQVKGETNTTFLEEDKIRLQSTLLRQLDNNWDSEIEIEGFKFNLVNIARVDNVCFAKLILRNFISQDLWGECEECKYREKCPIRKNVELVSAQFDRVSKFVEYFYRYLYENDMRMTIRQMVSQISYAITGNLTCEYVASHSMREPFFNYNFANLFFGYKGIKEDPNSSQIKGIAQIQSLKLDTISLDIDYKLFVSNDYSFFTSEIQEILQERERSHRNYYRINNENSISMASSRDRGFLLRRSFRRFYLVFGMNEPSDNIFNQIYGKIFTNYVQLISNKQKKVMLHKIQDLLFRALYIKNTGFLPKNTVEQLPLTLKRDDEVFQNVMIVLGTVTKDELLISQEPVSSKYEDQNLKQAIYLSVKGEKFLLTLPLLNYFEQLVEGSIASNNNPALSHGIAKLDTLLLDKFGDEPPESEEECELKILVNTTNGPEIRRYSFENHRLNILN